MGFDVTVHLVNPATVRAELVPWLLGERELDVAEELAGARHEFREALEEGDPAQAAADASLIGLAFASTRWPYQYCRGYTNLSLWSQMPDGERATLPDEFIGDVETDIFPSLIAEYPAMAGRFRTTITENCQPGVYIPADRVDEALAWVNATLDEMGPDTQASFESVRLVLRAAVASGLAVWEGTDAQVEIADTPTGQRQLHDALCELAGDPPLAVDADPNRWEYPTDRHFNRHCKWVGEFAIGTRHDVDDEGLVSTLIDGRIWPPVERPLPFEVDDLAGIHVAPDGLIVTVETQRREERMRFVWIDPGTPGDTDEPAVVARTAWRAFGADERKFQSPDFVMVGSDPVLIPRMKREPHRKRRPWIAHPGNADDGPFDRVDLALPERDRNRAQIADGVTTLSGTPVLVWHGDGFVRTLDGWECRYRLLIPLPDGQKYPQGRTRLVAGPGEEIWMVYDQRLWRVAPGEPPAPLLANGPMQEVRNLVRIDTMRVLIEGRLRGKAGAGCLGVIFDHNADTLLGIPQSLFGAPLVGLRWLPTVRRVMAYADAEVTGFDGIVAVPEDQLAGAPRITR